MTVPRTLAHAWAYLLRATEPRAPRAARLIAEDGPIEVVNRHLAGTLPETVRPEFRPDTVDWEIIEHDLVTAARLVARLVAPGDEEWPCAQQATTTASPASHGVVTPPIALWVRGTGGLHDLMSRSVAILGSRASTTYGEHHATYLAGELSSRGWANWNSAAVGIENHAQRGALLHSTPRLAAVLSHGLDLTHPSAHETLFARIAENGVIVSEYGFGTPPARRRHQARGHLIATLTTGIVIIEAIPRSGVLRVARVAHTLGRPVLATPGPVTSIHSNGCHSLIADGTATLVTGAADVERHLHEASTTR